jgi:hypothetical protein
MKKKKKFQLHDKSQWKNATARKHGQRFLLHQRGIISKTEIENSPSKRESGKKVNSFEIWTITGKKTSTELKVSLFGISTYAITFRNRPRPVR